MWTDILIHGAKKKKGKQQSKHKKKERDAPRLPLPPLLSEIQCAAAAANGAVRLMMQERARHGVSVAL